MVQTDGTESCPSVQRQVSTCRCTSGGEHGCYFVISLLFATCLDDVPQDGGVMLTLTRRAVI